MATDLVTQPQISSAINDLRHRQGCVESMLGMNRYGERNGDMPPVARLVDRLDALEAEVAELRNGPKTPVGRPKKSKTGT